MKGNKERSDKKMVGFNFVQMIEDKKRILKEADERRKLVRDHQHEKTIE